MQVLSETWDDDFLELRDDVEGVRLWSNRSRASFKLDVFSCDSEPESWLYKFKVTQRLTIKKKKVVDTIRRLQLEVTEHKQEKHESENWLNPFLHDGLHISFEYIFTPQMLPKLDFSKSYICFHANKDYELQLANSQMPVLFQ